MGGKQKRHLVFTIWPRPKGRKTDVWDIVSTEGVFLGVVEWKAHWRRYWARLNAGFDSMCLGELQDFLDERMQERKG